MIIGITGSFGTGKTTVACMFARLGAEIIDADKIVHNLLKDDAGVKDKLAVRFGNEILGENGEIDRFRLARKAFAADENLGYLNRIIHPIVIKGIRESVEQIKKQSMDSIIVVDAPLLFETGLDAIVDRVVVVTADVSRQAERLTRKGFRQDEAEARIRRQISLTEKEKRADYVIDNNAALEDTEKEVVKVWKEIREDNKR